MFNEEEPVTQSEFDELDQIVAVAVENVSNLFSYLNGIVNALCECKELPESVREKLDDLYGQYSDETTVYEKPKRP